jgi:hypothetical protein
MTAFVAALRRLLARCQGTKRSGSPLTAFFAAAYCQIAAGNRHSLRGRCIKDERSLHTSIWMVCRASYIHGRRLFWRRFRASFEVADHLRELSAALPSLGAFCAPCPGPECALLLRPGFKSYVTLLRHEKESRYGHVRWRRRLAIHCRAGQ